MTHWRSNGSSQIAFGRAPAACIAFNRVVLRLALHVGARMSAVAPCSATWSDTWR